MKKLVLTLLPLLAACGNPFQASVRAEKVCVRQIGQSIPGASSALTLAGAELSAQSRSLDDTFTITTKELADLQGSGQFDAALALQSFKFKPPEGTTFETLHIVLSAPPGSGLADVVLIDWPVAPGAEAGLIKYEGGEFLGDLSPLGSNLMDYLAEDNLKLDIAAEGNIPSQSWNANVEVCAGVEANYDYAKEIGL